MFEWRGPAPFYFVAVPSELCEDIRHQGAIATYGWGMVPVDGTINSTPFSTTLIPQRAGYVVPIKKVLREQHVLEVGDRVDVAFTVRFPQL